MSVYRLDKISHNKISSLNKEKTVVLATMSPLEVHGPHLPLGQDLFEAYAIAERAADKLAKMRPDWNFILTPPIPVAVDCVPKLGSVNFPAHLVRDVAYHTLAPFAKAGFARLAFSSFHGGPRHFLSLEDAAVSLTKDFGVPAVSIFSAVLARMKEGNVFYEGVEGKKGVDITIEQIREDHHAGWVETSLGLHLWPDLVDDGWQDLPASVSSPVAEGQQVNDTYLYGYEGKATLKQKLERNAATVKSIVRAIKHFSVNTYHGYPGKASAQQGKYLLDHLVAIAVDIFNQFIEQGAEFDGHSPLWRLKDIILNKPLNTVLEDWLGLYGQ